jgi:PAS domain S-box-containing protein
MQFVFSLFDGSQPGLILPNQFFGWLGWFVILTALGWGVRLWWENLSPLRERWLLLLILLVAAPLTANFIGLRLPGEVQPMPNTPFEFASPVLMIFAALPWMLAGGILGLLPALLTGLLSGTVLGIYSTHNPFTPLEIAGLALLFSVAVRQNYRTWFYRFLRHPMGAVGVVIIAYIPFLIWGALFSTNDTLAVRLDYALTQIWLVLAARSGEMFLAGLVAESLYLAQLPAWGRKRALVPSPSESNIQTRFFYGTVPLVAMLVLSLVVGDWLVAGRAAEESIRQRLESVASVAAESLPYFIETGQNLILTFATPDLLDKPAAELEGVLTQKLRSVPYFRQLFLFGPDSKLIAGFPEKDFERIQPTEEERSGISLALKGITTQVYIAKPLPNETSAQVSFIAAIRAADGETVQGVLLGRTDLNSNPFTQPVIQALSSMQSMNGQGMILSETGLILYHSVPSEVMKQYTGKIDTTGYFNVESAPNNTRQYVNFKPINGRPWSIVLIVPTREAQSTALGIAIPLLIMLFIFAVIAFIFLRISLRVVTSSLQVLAQEAAFISQGQLDHPLQVKGVDEVGRLSADFEQMRVSLKSRLEELNSLLRVSQGVAANLEINEAVQPILQAALVGEVSSVRLVFVPDVTLDASEHGLAAYGMGPAARLYAALDQQLFDLVRQQELINLPNLARTRRLQINPGSAHPGALIALPVRNESQYYGVFWVAYDRPHSFTEEEIRFLSTLAGEASLAATSARLYATAEVGRQRLEAVLSSTPEPVLVIDEQARLLLLNPAAVQVSGLITTAVEGKPIQEAVGSPDLVRLLTTKANERISSREINLPNGKIYYASVSPVVAEGSAVGKVCILRDITHFKELEQLKTDFVSTVSHDLRSPLTLMRGYATMLQMVGDLNEQQKGYVRKIVSGVENMSRLVSNLLDLGRIETGIGLQIEKVSLKDVVDEVINSLQLQATQKDIRLIQETSGSNPRFDVDADRALIQQALYNLVENAIKYTPVGGQVKVRLESRESSILVEVQDTGIGIAPLDLPHLFEKFYRSGRREAYQQRGTGLGLAIVKSIAERHVGRVWVDSQLGKGSIFSLEMPCEQPQKIELENEKFS